MAGESKRTVTIALGANAVIAVTKFAGGFLTGSAALFSEGAHSIADTMNQAFLLTSLKRSKRGADAQHPFGYGKERFFWALIAAVGILVAGAGFSTIEAYQAFTSHEHTSGNYFLIAYAVLVVAFLSEGTSWLRAVRQTRGEAKQAGRGVIEHIRTSSDPSVKTVAGEDTAALIGLVFAFFGIALHQATGNGWWEGVAAALIAVLLVVVGIALGNDVKGLLIGEAADPALRRDVTDYLGRHSAVDRVVDLLTMRLGADDVLLAARVDLVEELDANAVERISADIDHEIGERWPKVRHVFLDATRSDERVERVGLPQR